MDSEQGNLNTKTSTNDHDQASISEPHVGGCAISKLLYRLLWIYFILSIVFLGLKIWFTTSVTIIMPYEIIASSIQISISVLLILQCLKPNLKALNILCIVFAFSVVINIVSWILLLSQVTVVSYKCGVDAPNCIYVSYTIFILGIFLSAFNFCFLFYDLLLLKILQFYYKFLKEQKSQRHVYKNKIYKNTLTSSFPSDVTLRAVEVSSPRHTM
jgi:hypothetical protein